MRDEHDERLQRQRQLWQRAAPGYDRSMAPLERAWFRGGREWLGERAVGRVLEVGVGTGLNLPHYRAATSVAGVDLSPAMLGLARERAAHLGMPVELHTADASRLPFTDGTFDTVVAALVLCSVDSPAAVIAELRRVLVPGGRLLLLDHVASTWPPLRWAQRLVELASVRSANEHFTRRQLPLVERAGFRVVESERLRAGTIERVHATVTASTGDGQRSAGIMGTH